MKNLIPSVILATGLCFGIGSCSTLGELLDVPGAVVEDVGDTVDVVTPGEPTKEDEIAGKVAETAGDVAGIITGNPLIDMAITALVGGLLGRFLKRRKEAATPA